MRSYIAIFLVLMMSTLASGYVQVLHERQHEAPPALVPVAAATPIGAHHHHRAAPEHSFDPDCPLCIQLHVPYTSTSVTVFLIDTGRWVRYLSELAISQHSQTTPQTLSCRGPPAVAC